MAEYKEYEKKLNLYNLKKLQEKQRIEQVVK